MRRLALLTAAALALSACAQDTGRASQTPRPRLAASERVRPNIIVIMADDLGYSDVSTYPGGRIPTPNIDRLGGEGVVFTEGYVTAPICSPSRAGLMTGRYQERFGFEYNNGPDTRDAAEHLGLAPDEITLAQVMRGGGYRTAAIGKWHLGWNDEHYPTRRGFDEWWGFLAGQSNYIDPRDPKAINVVPPPAPGAPMTSIVQPYDKTSRFTQVITGPDRQVVDVGDRYLTEEITAQAIGFIDRNKDRPFFLHLAYNAPHTPLQTTKKYYDRFPDIANSRDRVYAAMVSALDDGVGAVVDHLDRVGLGDNTIVIFMSDNGCAAYVPGLCSAQTLSGGKLTMLEGGVRVPFMMRWPRRIKPHTVHTAPISSLDVFPTVVRAAGLKSPPRPYDGKDLMIQVADGAVWSRRPLYWRSTPIRAVREGDWKYLETYDGERLLYDLKADPRETVNLASREPQRVQALRSKLDAWESDKVAPAWKPRFVEFDFAGRHFKYQP
ncbi:sulfatase [Caulobacter sp. UNC358MFTsu5.1]|uniref:sulfatase family protein n=1 Tax=Caulobacter sp. UNC358MFTsu5.1 TaxID=1449049 RepID=UPI0009DD0FE7|nr:sulfatase-like hydrolase/transferase [Caulobacter sp. UNC358MFTsu5.1]